MDENTTSPLASFPNEHPEAFPPSSRRPFYQSKLFLISIITLIILGMSIVGGSMLLGTQQQKPKVSAPTPTQTKTANIKVTPSAITADWNIYKNVSYSYNIKYAKDIIPKELDTAEYGYTDLANGCMKIYAVHQSIVNTLPEEKNGIPWKQLEDLKTLPVGQNRNCSVLTFTFGEDGAAIVNRNDYTRRATTNMAGSDWYTFTVKNGVSNTVNEHTVSFTEKNNTTYLIETKTGGSCPTTPTDMLSTFSFAK